MQQSVKNPQQTSPSDALVGLMHGLTDEALHMHTPNPGSDPDKGWPEREVPNPSVPPDMEPVIPQHDPPQPGHPGEPPPIIAGTA